MKLQKTIQLESSSQEKVHALAVANGRLYVIDGDKLLEYEVPVETLWMKIAKFLGIKKYHE